MKLKKNFKEQKLTITAGELKIGEMMEVTDGDYTEHILLRTYDRLISLSNPNLTWDEPKNITIEGIRLLPGQSVTLIQE